MEMAMPHCIIEHSKDLTDLITPEEMMHAAHKGMLESGLFEPSDIKARTQEFAYFQADSIRQNFIHTTLKVLNGRSIEQKRVLSSLVLKALAELAISGVELSVDVQDMEKESYIKRKC